MRKYIQARIYSFLWNNAILCGICLQFLTSYIPNHVFIILFKTSLVILEQKMLALKNVYIYIFLCEYSHFVTLFHCM